MYIPRRTPEDGPKIIIFSGAGLSAPSGISTFRGDTGLWNDMDVDVVCNQRTWKANANAVHDFYNSMRTKLQSTEPSEGHNGIADIVQEYGKENVYVITQNIDNLLEKANADCLHVHGELTKMECEACGNRWDIGYKEWDYENDRCPKCDSKKAVRPGIVFFGGQAGMYSYMWRAFEHTMNKDSIVIIIGTAGNVVSVEENLIGTPCKKILCNLKPSGDINVKKCAFDKVYYESIETGIDKIKNDIKEWWKK